MVRAFIRVITPPRSLILTFVSIQETRSIRNTCGRLAETEKSRPRKDVSHACNESVSGTSVDIDAGGESNWRVRRGLGRTDQ